MRKLLFISLLLLPFSKVFAVCVPAVDPITSTTDEVFTRVLGNTIYASCILIPPSDPTGTQEAACVEMFTAYNECIFALSPTATPSIEPSPPQIVASPFDICLTDVAHAIFDGFPESPNLNCNFIPVSGVKKRK